MSIKTLTRKTVTDAARNVGTAKGDGVGLALRNYVRAATTAAQETGESAAVHGMHAARAVFLYVTQEDNDGGYVFRVKTGRVNVREAWVALVGDDVASGDKPAPRGLSLRMFRNHYKRGEALAQALGNLADIAALEEHALAVFRGEAKRQRGEATQEKEEAKATTNDPGREDTVTEVEADPSESVGASLLSEIHRVTRLIRAANGRMSEAEYLAARQALEAATAALAVVKPAKETQAA